IPDNTKMEEHSIVVDGGAIIGNYSDIGFGIIADSVIAGERVRINGNVLGSEEIRIDMWSNVGGDVRTRNQAFIGEFVSIDGKLVVGGDLDIGKDVKIGGGFEAKGWIVVRNPIPVIIYIYLYLTEMLRLGKGEEVEKALSELFSDDDDDIYGDKLLIIPNGSKVDMETIRVPNKADIGSGCRLMGNIRASSLVMGDDNTLFGSIKTMDDIVIGEGNTIHGNLITRGNVRVGKGTHILGEINSGKVTVHEEAKVDGPMRAPGGVKITRFEIETEIKTDGILDMSPEPVPRSEEIEEIFEIPKKRMNTAIRLSVAEKINAAKPKLKTTQKKSTSGTKAAAGKTKAKKAANTTKKTATEKKTVTKAESGNEITDAETVSEKKTTDKKTTTKNIAATGKTASNKKTTKKTATEKKASK
ncbi:MAG: hypothetical protein KAR85_01365, partial [Methanosarcinales archaeon]|nr:hypothetical protein [Methanosarcinales archaeon]